MANQSSINFPNQSRNNPEPPNKQGKNNVWLIAIILLIVVAVLWPIFRKNTPTDQGADNLTDGVATTTDLNDTILDVSNLDLTSPEIEPVQQVTAVGAVTPVAPVPTTMMVKTFFANSKLNPEGENCSMVYPIYRTVPRTVASARAALEELLKGVSKIESDTGFFTSLNAGVKINALTISNGVARVNLSHDLGEGVSGACKVASIRAQITETLKQFPTVQSVVISIDGISEGILQP